MEISATPNQLVRIFALGQLEIVVGCVRLHFNGASPRRPIELLKGLLAHGGRPSSQHALCEALWPDSEGDAAYRALITTVYRLRRLLHCAGAVTFVGGAVALDPELCWVDAWAFEQAIAHTSNPDQAAPALQLYRGPLMGDSESPLVFDARDRLRRKYLRAVLLLGQSLERDGDSQSAIELYEQAIEAEGDHEDLYRGLIACHARQGHVSAATAAYRRCRAMLLNHFGTAPAPATERAFRETCAFRPGSTAVQAPSVSAVAAL
jgi:DNA-binding SARP family transcriptional activator